MKISRLSQSEMKIIERTIYLYIWIWGLNSDNASILAHNCTYKLENRNKFVYYAKTEFRAQFTCSNLLIFCLFLFMENVRKFWCFLFKFIILILRVLFRIFFFFGVFVVIYICYFNLERKKGNLRMKHLYVNILKIQFLFY